MDKKELEAVIKYNEHAIFMAEIALSVLNGNESVLQIKGVKEIIATYLLIPYITRNHLDKPSEYHHIPQLDMNREFQKTLNPNGIVCDITLDNLRNAICHSFLTVEDRNDGYIIIDDRAIYDKKTHSQLQQKSLCQRLAIKSVETKLRELYTDIIEQQSDFNNQLCKKL